MIEGKHKNTGHIKDRDNILAISDDKERTHFKFEENQIVAYEIATGDVVLKGFGCIRGVATIPQIIIGRSYIIEDLSNQVYDEETYPFNTFVLSEMFIKGA